MCFGMMHFGSALQNLIFGESSFVSIKDIYDIESQRKYDNTSLNNHGLPVKQRCDKLSSA